MRHLIIIIYARLFEAWRKPLMLSDTTIKLIFMPGLTRLRNFNARARTYNEFVKAKRRVPAYKAFLRSQNFSGVTFKGLSPVLSKIPVADKDNYIRQFDLEQRCIHGHIPSKNIVIDESSGSSGTATNWVRGLAERKRNGRFIKFGIKTLFGSEPLYIINAFALGPWATGINVTMACVSFSKLKSLGPDKTKIINTLKAFGPKHKYIIMGYPPFLKLLADNADINWHNYDVSFIFGGESMSEDMRDYLLNLGIKKVYSSFGASDLELNISAENEFTIALRKLMRSHEGLRKNLLQHPGALPMLFQYNPSDFLFETSATGELVISICRPGYVSPKIRYNIHDRGHTLSLRQLYAVLKRLNIDKSILPKPATDLPLLFHYGRSDMSVSFFGATITPVDIQETIYKIPMLAACVNNFCLAVNEDKKGDKKLIVSLELGETFGNTCPDIMNNTIEFWETLAAINQDFREAKRMITYVNKLELRCYAFKTGPFEKSDFTIKAKYLNE